MTARGDDGIRPSSPELLRQMREQRLQLAVVERAGTLLGIVTLTDVVARVLPEATARAGGRGIR